MPFDSTLGGAAATSYIDVAAADAYFEGRLNTDAWDALDATGKQRVLMAATARLEQEKFAGLKLSVAQALKWPRVGVYDDDGRLYPQNAQPKELVAATCEQALVLVNAGTTDALALTGLEQFENIEIGDLNITPRAESPAAGFLQPQVMRWLRRLLLTSGGTSKLVRG